MNPHKSHLVCDKADVGIQAGPAEIIRLSGKGNFGILRAQNFLQDSSIQEDQQGDADAL
jgi:hypothetical protein